LRGYAHIGMTQTKVSEMTKLLPALPLLIMTVSAVVFVWRGFDTKPDGTNNRAKGGGAKWKSWK
jgi:hypothetical protein